jgi:hypothetical protein
VPRKRQPSWFRISLDDSKDLLNIIQTFGQARPENFCINISQPKTINILILICLVSWAPFISTPEGRLAAPRKRQPSWFRISLDDSKDLLNIIQTFGQARLENLRINISHPKTINILIPICLAIWAPSPASRMADSRRPEKTICMVSNQPR